MNVEDAMLAACAAVEVNPPKRRPAPGIWTPCDTYQRNGKNDGRVLIFDDGQGGIVWNHQTGASHRFSTRGEGEKRAALRRDPAKERAREADRIEVQRIASSIVAGCSAEPHPYLAAKGFPDELGLVCADPWRHLPAGRLGERIARALPEGDGPLLVIPGRIGRQITTVQFITPDGAKKNILGGAMGGAAHRIATGRETWVCEGIATALSVRAALRLLGRPATVLSAFSAQNVAKVAEGLSGAVIAADHDKPIESFGGMGTGEHYARQSGCRWSMPPARGDWNDHHQAHGLRSVAILLRQEVPP